MLFSRNDLDNGHLPVTTVKIQFGENCGTWELVLNFIGQRQWICIFFYQFVNCSIVNANAQVTCLLWYKHCWCCQRAAGFFNNAPIQHVLKPGFHFLTVASWNSTWWNLDRHSYSGNKSATSVDPGVLWKTYLYSCNISARLGLAHLTHYTRQRPNVPVKFLVHYTRCSQMRPHFTSAIYRDRCTFLDLGLVITCNRKSIEPW